MSPYITLTRKAAAIKLESARKATYFMQVDGGDLHCKEVPVSEMVRAFHFDDRARLRIRTSDSLHKVTITENAQLRTGYVVEF